MDIIWYLLWTIVVTAAAARCNKAWLVYLLIALLWSPLIAGIILVGSCIIFGTDD